MEFPLETATFECSSKVNFLDVGMRFRHRLRPGTTTLAERAPVLLDAPHVNSSHRRDFFQSTVSGASTEIQRDV